MTTKLDNFWYHYKVHVLVVIAVVATALYLGITWEESKSSELDVIVVGNNVEKEEQISLQESATEALLRNNTDSIIKFDFWLAANGLASGKHADLQGKFMAMVSGKNVDIIILDTDAFNLYAEIGTFLKLESLEKKIPGVNDYMIAAEGKHDNKKYDYGIKIEGSKLLERAGFNTEDKVLAVIANPKNPKLSLESIKWILGQ